MERCEKRAIADLDVTLVSIFPEWNPPKPERKLSDYRKLVADGRLI